MVDIVTRYEYAQLTWHSERGWLYNFSTDAPLQEYTAEAGWPYALAQLSAEGWRIVSFEKQVPYGDNDWSVRVGLQRP